MTAEKTGRTKAEKAGRTKAEKAGDKPAVQTGIARTGDVPAGRQDGPGVLSGLVTHIVYHNEENGYTVLNLMSSGSEVVCVGNMPAVDEGEYVRVEGTYVVHASYGEQFKVSRITVEVPEDTFSIERYLGSGAIKGVGPKLAGRIVKAFGTETFQVIETEPERLASIKGISERMAQAIALQYHEKQDLRRASMFLADFGISSGMAVKIYNQYGSRLYDILRENPYQLADDITGIGFKLADAIAARAGIGQNSEYRIRSAVIYVLSQGITAGHTYLPDNVLADQTAALLGLPSEAVGEFLTGMAIDKKIVIKDLGETRAVYSAPYYYMELSVARMLYTLSTSQETGSRTSVSLERRIRRIEEESGIELDELQRTAVREAAGNGVMIITGGPGTGKTTTINTLIRCFEEEQMEILLAAPTGRAAKRMQEATGRPAATIHRMLELTGDPLSTSAMHFERNESNPLEADLIIIDEMSMVDISLMNALLKAVLPGTRLVLVGDVNQLPSVGPGNVLGDLIASGCFHVVRLNRIFRQASKSAIIMNAHRINDGEQIDLEVKTRDFFCMKRYDAASVVGVMIALIRDKLPPNVGAQPFEIQVLTPMRKGELGVERLNTVLQAYLNPPSGSKQERPHGDGVFREGDKVMQTKNNYQLDWEVVGAHNIPVEQGVGVFNGDTGVILEINPFAEQMVVLFDESHRVTYPFSMLDELELAYAMTVHKSQGSEYPAVILPLLGGPRMLFNRNILYTAVTRARKCVVIVGSEEIVAQMIRNENEQKRYTTLKDRIEESWR